MPDNFAKRALHFHEKLRYTGGPLPAGIRVMNPFVEFPETLSIITTFFGKYYNDDRPRRIILGINPGRLGGALTGIPFTDPKRLINVLKIPYNGKMAHEPSSVFIYEMIEAYGGPELFYKNFYINSPCPLGFSSIDVKGREKNYNYYDSAALLLSAIPFMTDSVKKLIELGIKTDVAFCLGTGKNADFLQSFNAKHNFFKMLIPLEHPRYIMQYKSRNKKYYIDKYIQALRLVS
jgi:hypothetical protein